MERTSFARITTALLVLATMTRATSARAESCFVDLEEETADQDRVFALYVGRDNAGVVLCLGQVDESEDDSMSPRMQTTMQT
jgi:hypothetical protein